MWICKSSVLLRLERSGQQPIKARRRARSGKSPGPFAVHSPYLHHPLLVLAMYWSRESTNAAVFSPAAEPRSLLPKIGETLLDGAALHLWVWTASGQNGGLLGMNSAALCVGRG
jgi:hypothetical protein